MSRNYIPCGCIVIIDNTQRYLALSSTSAHTTILSTTSRTTLTQTYINNTGSLLREARYVFPIYDGVSVVEFTCTIGKDVIKGVVKEREEAKRVFQQAVERGQAAGLLEQSLSASDVFTTKLGNVPAGEEVKVEITYLGELEHDAELDGVRFTIPTAIAPRYGDSMRYGAASAPEVTVDGKIAITVDVDMGSGCAIKSVQSPSHPISVNIGTMSTSASSDPSLQMASASLSLGSANLDKDFVVQVVSSGLGSPAALLEVHPTIPNRRTIMTSLVPRFNLPVEKPEVVFVCDRSGSMGSGQKMPNLISALKIFLKSLPVGVRFNICSFGSHHSFLWPKSVEYTQQSLDKAIRHVETFSDDYGGTEMLAPMQDTFKKRIQESNLEVFLLTDGEIWDQNELFELINTEMATSKGAIRVFTLGIGEDVSHALIKGVARAGNGFSQIAGENEKIDKKIVRMLKGALTPHITDYTLEIKYDKANEAAGPETEPQEDDFELVEKVMDALTIDVQDLPEKVDEAKLQDLKTSISLFDSSVKNEDLEMKDASDDLEKEKASLPPVDVPKYLQTPFDIPPLFPFHRTTAYVMLSEETPDREPKSVILKGTSRQGPLELEIPITKVDQNSATLHQLAARKAVQELEDGKGWLYHAKDAKGQPLHDKWAAKFSYIAKREAVRLGVEYQVGGKWCSFVAVSDDDYESEETVHAHPEEVMAAYDSIEHANLRMACSVDHARKSSGGRARHIVQSAAMAMGGMGQAMRQRMAPITKYKARAFKSSTPQLQFQRKSLSEEEEEDEDMGFALCADSLAPAAPAVESRSAPTTQPESEGLSGLAALQSFIGSWNWSAQLENILGITQVQATKAIKLSANGDVASMLATLCTLVYLKKKMAADKDSWELMADKAENWLQDQTGQTVEELEALVEDAKLFV